MVLCKLNDRHSFLLRLSLMLCIGYHLSTVLCAVPAEVLTPRDALIAVAVTLALATRARGGVGVCGRCGAAVDGGGCGGILGGLFGGRGDLGDGVGWDLNLLRFGLSLSGLGLDLSRRGLNLEGLGLGILGFFVVRFCASGRNVSFLITHLCTVRRALESCSTISKVVQLLKYIT